MPTSRTAKATPIRRTHAIQRSAACNRSARTGLTRTASLDPLERLRRTRVDTEPARAAVELELRRRLDLHVRDERAEHDPRAVTTRDQQRVLAVEADARSSRSLAVDMLVRVHEHAVATAEPP